MEISSEAKKWHKTRKIITKLSRSEKNDENFENLLRLAKAEGACRKTGDGRMEKLLRKKEQDRGKES